MPVSSRQRTVQYPWGATCPVYWPKAYAVLRLKGWDTHFSPELIRCLGGYCPNIEWLETGELLLDISSQQRDYSSPVQMMQQLAADLNPRLKNALLIGLAGEALAAFLVVRQQQAKLLNVVPAWDAERVLSAMPVQSLDNLLSGVSVFLAQYKLRTVADVQQLPASYLAQRFGDMGRAIMLLAQNKPVPRSLWDSRPPVELSQGLVFKTPRRLEARHFEQQVDSLNQQLRKRHFEAGQLVAEIYTEQQDSAQLILSCAGDQQRREQIQTYLDQCGESRCSGLRLIAREIRTQRIQGELFAETA